MQRDAVRWAKWLLLGILVMAVVAGLERFQPLAPRPVQALENPADNRLEMIGELRKINERLDRLVAVIEAGKIKVTVANADEIRQPAAAKPAVQEGGAKDNADEPRIIIKRKAQE